jgi:hypothetical protein
MHFSTSSEAGFDVRSLDADREPGRKKAWLEYAAIKIKMKNFDAEHRKHGKAMVNSRESSPFSSEAGSGAHNPIWAADPGENNRGGAEPRLK